MHSLEYLQSKVIDLFNQLKVDQYPENLYKPIEYAMSQGGKRFRPLIALIGCELFGGKIEDVVPAAIGLEVFHNFTLLHDDIMDNSPIRRGMPTVHKKWDPNTAILSGDTMFVIAYDHITRSHPDILPEILRLFNQTAREVCEGQQLDMDYEKRKDVSISDYLEMIRLKTAVLIAGSLKAGAIAARAPQSESKMLYDYGINMGLAFQLMDDLLDTFGDEKVFGKKTGMDILTNKKTFLYLKAYEKADNSMKKQLDEAFAIEDGELKISRVLELFNVLNIKPETEMMIDRYRTFADNILDSLKLRPENRMLLNELTQKLTVRKV